MKARQQPPGSVDQYIATFPGAVQSSLRRVRRAIRTAVPEAGETIAYNMAAYKLDGRGMLYFAGWKAHYSLYPATASLLAAFRDALAPYDYNAKGTIRFRLSEPVPEKLIGDIARFRAREVRTPPSGEVGGRRRRGAGTASRPTTGRGRAPATRR